MKITTRENKDQLISVRLDSESRVKLEKMANANGLGPSTFARHVLLAVINGTINLSTTPYIKGNERTISDASKSVQDTSMFAKDASIVISTIKSKINDAHSYALRGEWQLAITLLKQISVEAPQESFDEVQSECKMIWATIQSISVKPQIDRAEKSIIEWHFDEVKESLNNVLIIFETSHLPLIMKICHYEF